MRSIFVALALMGGVAPASAAVQAIQVIGDAQFAGYADYCSQIPGEEGCHRSPIQGFASFNFAANVDNSPYYTSGQWGMVNVTSTGASFIDNIVDNKFDTNSVAISFAGPIDFSSANPGLISTGGSISGMFIPGGDCHGEACYTWIQDISFDVFTNSHIQVIGLVEEVFPYGNAGFGWTAVPEPATWLLMILGFGMVGASSRTRKTSLA